MLRFIFACLFLQSKDDTVAELRRIYTLQILSASNGANISSIPGSFISNVVFVASDYPHGLFEFSLPEITTITEDTAKVKECYVFVKIGEKLKCEDCHLEALFWISNTED